mgnify:CR=1 FL=1
MPWRPEFEGELPSLGWELLEWLSAALPSPRNADEALLLTREQALYELTKSPVFPELGLEPRVMGYPKRRHEDFKIGRGYERIAKTIRWIKNF